MALFRAQASEYNVIITTALVPGAKAPTLVPLDVVESMKPGGVIVDLAAEQGGNCALTKPDAIVEHNGVRVVGFTDLPSRMARVASRFLSMNVANLLAELVRDGQLHIDLENDVVRPALVVHRGEILEPPPRKEPAPAPQKASARPRSVKPPPPDAKPQQQHIQSPTRLPWGNTLVGFVVIAALFYLGRFAPGDFLQHFTVFILACFVGWQVVWSVAPALHTPLMSVTNAISGIIVVGGLLQINARFDVPSLLGALAVFVATINISGGFLVTRRMLAMFRKGPAAEGAR